MAVELLWNGPQKSRLTIALAHSAGAPMDTPFMEFFAEGFAGLGYRVARFEFPFMAARRKGGHRKPPDRQPVMLDIWHEVIAQIGSDALVIGGKSMGGRMASLIADEVKARGLLCLGYPFYGAGRRDTSRIEHLLTLQTPTLICQGTRDAMGGFEDISALKLAESIQIHWAEDGDHDLKPRQRVGKTHDQNLTGALDAAEAFLATL